MKRMINITNSQEDLERYDGAKDLWEFCRKYGCDGVEYMGFGEEAEQALPKEMVVGVHLVCLNEWMDLWTGNQKSLLEEYGTKEYIQQQFGGTNRQALVDYLKKQLDFAERMEAEYVVFHVSQVKIRESISYQFDYNDRQVIEAITDWINEVLDDKSYHFYFLMENLWWPGFTFTNPEMTKLLMERVKYQKKGIMLDTGHLLHTNLDLTSQEEGVAYINECLEKHGELCKWIKGIHLQQSITGDIIKRMVADPIVLKEDYYERWCQIFEYIFQIDQHKPFTAKGVPELIKRINPLFLTMELISKNRQEHEELLELQCKCLE